MKSYDEGGLRFTFPDEWEVIKLDETTFYKKRFQSFAKAPSGTGSKSVDFVAFMPRLEELWLIEVKDYRAEPRAKPTDLFQESAENVRDSLVCIHAMAANAGGEDQSVARRALGQYRLRVFLHLEQPEKHSKLKPQIVDPTMLKQKLKQTFRAIDPHPLGGGIREMNRFSVPWDVISIAG